MGCSVRKSREEEGGVLSSGLRGGMRRGWSTVSSRFFDLKGKVKGGFYGFWVWVIDDLHSC